jgi:hypothetical protein
LAGQRRIRSAFVEWNSVIAAESIVQNANQSVENLTKFERESTDDDSMPIAVIMFPDD